MRNAEKLLKEAVVSVNSFNELEKNIKDKKIVLANLCSSIKCEEELKFKTNGAKVLNIDENKKANGKCIICSKKAEYIGRIGKSY